MKILHTSDWHIGHTLYEHDRMEEHISFLSQLSDIIATESPDALIVSGDVYDRTNPSVAVQNLYYKSLLEFHNTCPDMDIIVTAGNHDSKSMLELGSDLWELARVKVIGRIEKKDEEIDFDRHIIDIRNKAGKTEGFIVAVPHIFEHSFPVIDDVDSCRSERKRKFFQTLLDRTAERNTDNMPVVMTAHLTLANSNITGHDADVVGGINESSHDELGSGFDYLALGHIHYPQTIQCNGAVARYCGSPLPISFDETYPHSVSLVSLEKGKNPEIREIRIKNIKPMLTVPSQPVTFSEALKELDNISPVESCYIRLNVLLDSPMPADYVERISSALQGKKADYCYCKITRNAAEEDEEDAKLTYDEFQELTPVTVAQMFYKSKFGCEMSDNMEEMLVEAIRRYEDQKQDL